MTPSLNDIWQDNSHITYITFNNITPGELDELKVRDGLRDWAAVRAKATKATSPGKLAELLQGSRNIIVLMIALLKNFKHPGPESNDSMTASKKYVWQHDIW